MAKKVHKIEAFEGGINQLADPRDIEDNQFEELFNVDVSNKGRITLPGNALQVHTITNVKDVDVSPGSDSNSMDNGTGGLTPGYGLYAFSHDFNMQSLADTDSGNPDELDAEFICINDGAHIDIWDSCHTNVGNELWIQSAIKMGEVHLDNYQRKVKPIYYKADNGLRVCDANFGQKVIVSSLNEDLDTTETAIDVTSGLSYVAGEYIKINSEVMKITSIDSNTLTVVRAQFGTTETAHDTGTNISKINVPKILTHINRPLLEKAEGASPANTIINRWVEDIQIPEMPPYGALEVLPNVIPIGNTGTALNTSSLKPNGPGKVIFGIQDSSTTTTGEYFMEGGTLVQLHAGNTEQNIVIFTLVDSEGDVNVMGEGFAIGKSLTVYGAEGDGVIYNGVWEIVGFGDDANEVKVACEYAQYTPPASSDTEPGVRVILEEQLISDDLKSQWIFGMSYLYDGGGSEIQESNIRIGSIFDNGDNRILSHEHAAFLNSGFWKTAEYGDITATGTFNVTESDNWVRDSDLANAVCDGNGWLLYDNVISSNNITAGAYYIVSIVMSNYTSGNFDVYVGKDGDSSGGTTKNIDGDGFHQFVIQAQESGADVTNIIAIKGNSFNGSLNYVTVQEQTSYEMDFNTNADLRGFFNAGLSGLTFLCNNSRSGATQNNSWNERISGFRIYMKQVDMIGGGLSEEWLMLYDVDLVKGTYLCHGKDGSEEKLQLANPASTADDWSVSSTATDDTTALVTTAILGDRVSSLPLLTYQSENGYSSDTNLGVMYKAVTVVQRKVYIGNLKIGERTYPDRMLRADADRFDSFPDDGAHYIDVATADGDSITELESFGDKLLQFKKKTAYLIKVTTEGEELEETWRGAGVLSPSQVVNTKNGVVWVNNNGLFLYDGEKLNHITEKNFTSDDWAINENEETPVLLGYDEKSNKVIIQTLNTAATDSGGFIYDLATGAITQSQKLFNWYIADESSAADIDKNPIGPPISVNLGDGPIT